MSVRTGPATRRTGTVGGAHQAGPHSGEGFDGLGDTWEITERAYFPIRQGSLVGKIIRINDSRWVSIGHSTAAWLPPFEADSETGLPNTGLASWRYGATLWENTFDGELRRLQQVDLLDCYDSSQVQLDTADGWTWALCSLRLLANGGALPLPKPVPWWSARRLVIDPETGALSAGPLVVWEYHALTGGIYTGGDLFGIAAMTNEQAVFFASVGSVGSVHPTGHLYAVELELGAGSVGAHSKTDPGTLGWTPAPEAVGSTFGVTAQRLSASDGLVVLFPLNVDAIPSNRYLVVEAHFDAGAGFVGSSALMDISTGSGSGIFGSALRRCQLNMVFLPAVTSELSPEGDILAYTAFAWINGTRYMTPELVAYNTGSFLVGTDFGGRFASRYLDWYGDADHPNGTISQQMWSDLEENYKDWWLVQYAPTPTVVLALDRQLEKSLWFNTLTDYRAAYGDQVDTPEWAASVGDFFDNSPGNRYQHFMWMLSPGTWCGLHQDTPGEYLDGLGEARQFVATWGSGGGARAAATHESGTVRIQRGVR